jgi:hypothetical protein
VHGDVDAHPDTDPERDTDLTVDHTADHGAHIDADDHADDHAAHVDADDDTSDDTSDLTAHDPADVAADHDATGCARSRSAEERRVHRQDSADDVPALDGSDRWCPAPLRRLRRLGGLGVPVRRHADEAQHLGHHRHELRGDG